MDKRLTTVSPVLSGLVQIIRACAQARRIESDYEVLLAARAAAAERVVLLTGLMAGTQVTLYHLLIYPSTYLLIYISANLHIHFDLLNEPSLSLQSTYPPPSHPPPSAFCLIGVGRVAAT